MADQAILNVYQHILDSWGVITSPIKMIINNEIGNGVLMQLQAVISNNELQDLTLFIQQVTMSGLLNINNFCDDIFNILSMFIHEGKHISDWESGAQKMMSYGKAMQEYRAYYEEVYNGYLGSATPNYQAFVLTMYNWYKTQAGQ